MNRNAILTHIALMIPVALISLNITLLTVKKNGNLNEFETLYCI